MDTVPDHLYLMSITTFPLCFPKLSLLPRKFKLTCYMIAAQFRKPCAAQNPPLPAWADHFMSKGESFQELILAHSSFGSKTWQTESSVLIPRCIMCVPTHLCD